jgi:hypothetical protein
MPTMLEQPATQQVDTPTPTPPPTPSVTYDSGTSTINATVIVSLGDEQGTFHHHVPAISVPGPTGGTWTVIWTLEPSGPELSVTFGAGGILIPRLGTSLPDGVGIVLFGSAPGQCQFINNVTDVNVLHYDLDLNVNDSEGHSLKRSTNIIFDPTISVVKEPMDG